MELRGTVLNVVDFGAFVDVGLSDSGLVHISQLSAGYVRDPHDVIAVGDQVRVWVATIDRERRRVALTMIPPGTERVKPEKQRRPRRDRPAPQPAAQAVSTDRTATPAERTPRPQRRPAKQQGRGRRDAPRQQPRTGAYEKRAPKVKVPITKEMEEGKEFMRSFGDLLQFHQKKKEKDSAPPESTEAAVPPPPPAHAPNNGPSNGSTDENRETPVMSAEANQSGS
jgi:uncharacterized protein